MEIYSKEMENKEQNSIIHKVDSMATLRKELMGHWNVIKQKLIGINQKQVGRTTFTETESKRLVKECTPPHFDKNYYEEQFYFLRNQLKSTDDMLNECHEKTGNFVKQIDRLRGKREELVEMMKDTLVQMKKVIRCERKECENCETLKAQPIFDPIYSMNEFVRKERKRRMANRTVFPNNVIIEKLRLQLKDLLNDENETSIEIAIKQNTHKVQHSASNMAFNKNGILQTSHLAPKDVLEVKTRIDTVDEQNVQDILNKANKLQHPNNNILQTPTLKLKKSFTEEKGTVAEQNTQDVQQNPNGSALQNNEVFDTSRLQLKDNLKEEKVSKTDSVNKQNKQDVQHNVKEVSFQKDKTLQTSCLQPKIILTEEKERNTETVVGPNTSSLQQKDVTEVKTEIVTVAEQDTQDVQINPWSGKVNETKISKPKNVKERKNTSEEREDSSMNEMKKQIKELQEQILKEKKMIVKANEQNVELQNSLIEAEKAHQSHLEDLKKERDGFLSVFKEKRRDEEKKIEEIVENLIKDHKKQQSELGNFRVELEREKSVMKNQILKERQRNKEMVEQKNELARGLFKMKEQMKMTCTEQKSAGLNDVSPGLQMDEVSQVLQIEQPLPSTAKETSVISHKNPKSKKSRKKNH